MISRDSGLQRKVQRAFSKAKPPVCLSVFCRENLPSLQYTLADKTAFVELGSGKRESGCKSEFHCGTLNAAKLLDAD